MTQACARCGAAFECGADGDACWCAEVVLDADALAALRDRFTDCLCPACLRAPATAPAPDPTYSK